MRKFFLFFIGSLLFSLFACNPKEEKIPADILPVEKMRDVVVGLNLSEAIINQNNTLKKENKDDLKFNVYKENGITNEQYLKSMKYYSLHPTQLKKIYEKAMEKLNVMKEGN